MKVRKVGSGFQFQTQFLSKEKPPVFNDTGGFDARVGGRERGVWFSGLLTPDNQHQ